MQDNPSAFEAVSQEYSSDVVAKEKGGDLGYFGRGMMAKPFENFCYFGKEGDLGLVPTQFGFHIIEITDQKGANQAYKIGQVIREILPSDETSIVPNSKLFVLGNPEQIKQLNRIFGI